MTQFGKEKVDVEGRLVIYSDYDVYGITIDGEPLEEYFSHLPVSFKGNEEDYGLVRITIEPIS